MASGSGESTLTNTFNAAKKVWHWHHTFMFFSMMGMGMAALVASGGTYGFLDLAAKYAGWVVEGICLLYTSPSPRDLSTSRMPSSA